MIALIDCRAHGELIDALKKHGFEIISMPPSPILQVGVSSHTDMLIFIGFQSLFCHASYYKNNTDLIDNIVRLGDLSLMISDEKWSGEYPCDVLFNACLIGKKLICNKKTVSKLILNKALESGYEIIGVPQGYTKCSICQISDNAVITADLSIAQKCAKAEIDVLLITEGHVSLPPYNFGFLGGASGTCNDKVFFCGSLDTHPDADNIKFFCRKHKKEAISLSNRDLQDVGSIFFIGE